MSQKPLLEQSSSSVQKYDHFPGNEGEGAKCCMFIVDIIIKARYDRVNSYFLGNAQECPVLPNPSNGRIKYSRGRRVGASVWYACSSGYTLIGSESRTCLRNLSWSLQAPNCRRTWIHLQWKGDRNNVFYSL